MAVPRQAAARAGAVSRALRKAGFGVHYRESSGWPAMEVRANGWQPSVTVALDTTVHRARPTEVASALLAAGYAVAIVPLEERNGIPGMRYLTVTREGWT